MTSKLDQRASHPLLRVHPLGHELHVATSLRPRGLAAGDAQRLRHALRDALLPPLGAWMSGDPASARPGGRVGGVGRRGRLLEAATNSAGSA